MSVTWMIFEILGTIAFAFSGAIVGLYRRMDIFGITVLAVMTGVGGGMMVASLSHGVSSYVFMHSIHVYCVPSDLYIGVFKSVIFGMIVALVGCDRGMTCTAGAEGVGKATTQSVVYSIIMLFVANYILSSILF